MFALAVRALVTLALTPQYLLVALDVLIRPLVEPDPDQLWAGWDAQWDTTTLTINQEEAS